jgi:hypothetical protein
MFDVMIFLIIWAVLSTALIPFCFWKAYRLGFRLGYKKGAEEVLVEWKKYMLDMEDIKNENNSKSYNN